VNFYNAVARHFVNRKYNNIPRAIEINKRAFALAEQTDDVELQLKVLETELHMANRCDDPNWLIEVVRKGRDIAGFVSMGPREHTWLLYEAWAHLWMGNLSHALDLSMQVEAQLASVGMGDSDRYLAILDLRTDVHWLKSEYVEARQILALMVKKTSLECSPGYHAHALCCMAEMDILMEGEITDIVTNLNAAEAIYVARNSSRSAWWSLVAAELELYRGCTENARVAFLDCLSNCRGNNPGTAKNCMAALADPVNKMHGTMDNFRWALVYFAFAQKNTDAVGTLQALRRLADVHILMDDDETALHLFQLALKGGTKRDIHRLRAECMVGIGDIMLRRGDPIQAQEIWGTALPLFLRSSRMRDVTTVEKRLEKLSQAAQDNSRSLRVSGEAVDESKNSVSEVLTLSDSDTAVVESTIFNRLVILSAPTTSPSPQVTTAEDQGSSTDRHAKLSVL
jgi:hypothetical protein